MPWATALLVLACTASSTSAFSLLRLPLPLATPSLRPPSSARAPPVLSVAAGEQERVGSRKPEVAGRWGRRDVLAGLAIGAGSLWAAQPEWVLAEESEEGPFTVAFNVSKGPLGIKLQELRFPPKKAPWDTQQAVVIVSAVDPLAQGIRQDKRLRSGLTVVSVQGRSMAGKSAKEAIKELELEIVARTGPKERWDAAAAAKAGIPELVEITFSDACVSLPDQPDVCYNSVMPVGSVQPMDITDDEEE